MNKTTNGWINGFIGVLIFSGSLPATRLAVTDFNPLFLTVCRAAIAGVLAGGLLPLATAIFGVLRGGERPRPVFWVFSAAGSLLVAGFALIQGGGSSPLGDAYMLASIVVCGLGYAEGARLSRRLGNWQVISWALVLSLPLMLPLSFFFTPDSWSGIGVPALLSLAYVSLFSMLIGFVFWYRGLAQGGIAAVGQLQLLQPFFGLLLASVILHEKVGWALVAVNIAVIMCVAAARRFAK
ncbi:DMT family transporter [Bacillus rugosus]|uniref:DMT family transporter n=1 Tax=Bacillus rugosus TaxID=2715209 RepID=UPI0035A34E17